MGRPLFLTKPVDKLIADSEEGHRLKKSLGAMDLVMLGIGAIIGAGLFSLTGIAAADNAGPAVTLSFVVAAIGCAFAGLCYAEFASTIPVAGSAYTYAYATMGELMAWIIGWDLVLEYAVGASTVAISWSRYFMSLLHEDLGIHIPPQLAASPLTEIPGVNGAAATHGIINIPAAVIVFLISCLLIRGTRESAWVNNLLVIVKVSIVVLFIALGWKYINPSNYEPYIPPNEGELGAFGWSGILRGAGVVFFAFIGFDAVSTAAQESKNPQRHMPIGIIGSLLICTILYVLFAHVLTGIVNYKEFKGEAAPVARAVGKTDFGWLGTAVKIAILAGYSSVMLVMLLGQSRVFLSMSRDGLLPRFFSELHPRFATPWKSNLLFAFFCAAFAAFLPVKLVGEITSMGTLLAFIIVSAGILVMREKQPDLPRAFKTPFLPWVPILGILWCGAMLASLLTDWTHTARLFGWLGVGLAIYFAYGRQHSRLQVQAAAKGQA